MTSTSSFGRPVLLWDFGSALTTNQKWSLHKAHLIIKSRLFTAEDFHDYSTMVSAIAMLYGLNSLHVCVDMLDQVDK